MKRKIVQHGSSSLTVTLPIKWTEKYNLKKGDEVNVEEAGPLLKISTEQEIASPKKEIDATTSGIFTKNNLSHLYQLGYDEITVRFNNGKTLESIRQRIPDCIGFEIIDQKPNRVLIKSIATTIDTEFDTLLRKSFQVTNEMAKEILEAIKQQHFAKLKEIRNMETLNNRFTDVCIRILNKKGYNIPQRTMQIYEIVKNIERIADEFKYICDAFENHKKKIDPSLLSLFKETIDYYLAFYSIFYKFNPKLKEKLYLERKTLLPKLTATLKQTKGKDSLFLHHMIDIVKKTYEGAGGYFALIL